MPVNDEGVAWQQSVAFSAPSQAEHACPMWLAETSGRVPPYTHARFGWQDHAAMRGRDASQTVGMGPGGATPWLLLGSAQVALDRDDVLELLDPAEHARELAD